MQTRCGFDMLGVIVGVVIVMIARLVLLTVYCKKREAA